MFTFVLKHIKGVISPYLETWDRAYTRHFPLAEEYHRNAYSLAPPICTGKSASIYYWVTGDYETLLSFKVAEHSFQEPISNSP